MEKIIALSIALLRILPALADDEAVVTNEVTLTISVADFHGKFKAYPPLIPLINPPQNTQSFFC